MEKSYDNRELSWLKFNERVLSEAKNENIPVINRLKFLAIATSNLDEFYMVRVGSLLDKIEKKEKSSDNKTGLTNKEQVKKIFEKTNEFYKEKKEATQNVFEKLAENGICIKSADSLFGGREEKAKKIFENLLKPFLSVFVTENDSHFPHLENGRVYCAFHLTKKGKGYLGIIAKSEQTAEVFTLKEKDSLELIVTDDLILKYGEKLFPNFRTVEKCFVRFTRSADMDLTKNRYESDEEYRSRMKLFLKKRIRLAPVRTEISKNVSKAFKKLILNKNKKNTLIVNRNYLSFDFVYETEKIISKELREKLSYKKDIQSVEIKNVMKAVSREDIFLSYPFDTVNTFINLLEEASADRDVLSVKITLYRLSEGSRIVSSLIKASKNGKNVVAVIEPRARFDEENNINYAEILEENGVKVILGLKNEKIHSKLCLIEKKGKDKYITQCGTGNYNEKTANQYTDMNIITRDVEIGRDAKDFFEKIENGSMDFAFQKLISSPNDIEETLIKLIDCEIMYHRLYKNGRIILKVNSLTHKKTIDKLNEASESGVKIQLLVRGICCLVPKNDNITVVSIVGKYLEHSRVYFFNCNNIKKIYISSADIMTRNLENRVEIACPVESREIKEKITDTLELMLKDDVNASVMNENGIYEKKETKENINSQEKLFATENSNEKIKKSSEKTTYIRWLIHGGDI